MWVDTFNSYLFSPYDTHEFRNRVEQTCTDNWKAYLGIGKDYYWFDADEAIATARKKNDQLMVSYIQNLQKYLKCSDEKRQEQWDYPTKEQLAKRRQTLVAVRSYAQTKLKSRLRSQHALLVMRCNMLLGDHAQNVTFWHTTGSIMIESVYRDMMRNIYAGALCKTGSEAIGAKIFAEQGDWESLMTLYYKRRSCQAIRQEYLREPDSPVLPFLLKDFVNNAQEAIDAQNDVLYEGKLFIRNITRQEAQQMCQLCRQVVSEGKTDVPAMWQSALAWLEFLFGNRQQGVRDIAKAAALNGTQRMKDNARVLHFYMKASEMPSGKALDDFVAAEMEWLEDKTGGEDEFFRAAFDRIAHQVLMTRYASQPVRQLAIEKVVDCPEYSIHADTMRVETLLQYRDYASTSGQTPLDSYLIQRLELNTDSLNDLVGTKYLRLCQWDKAISWLQKVPTSFYNRQGYVAYAAKRQWTVEPWIKRQWVADRLVYGETKWQLKENPKLAFARDIQRLEANAKVLTGKAQQQCWFDLAVRYAQVDHSGDCWFVMRDGKSAYDTVRVNETDFAARAVSLLQRVVGTTADLSLKERALFALSYAYLNQSSWYEEEWDSQKGDVARQPRRQSTQWRAFAALATFEQQHTTSSYVSRCDEYRQFMKYYR